MLGVYGVDLSEKVELAVGVCADSTDGEVGMVG